MRIDSDGRGYQPPGERPNPQQGLKIETALLKCPNCHGDIALTLRCEQCDTAFTFAEGIYSFLPSHLELAKRNEDSVFAPGGDEAASAVGRPWRRILSRLEILRFDYEVVDLFRGGRFLELGGETCFASAIFKSVFPDSVVYASDISPNALRAAAIPTAALFPRQPDFFLALDAEEIPFKDNTFDAVFALTMIHHLPDPSAMLAEVRRVLRPGGRFIAIDAAVPPHFRWLFSRVAQERATKYGIKEDLISYDRWESLVRGSGLPLSSLHIYTNPRYQYSLLFRLAGRIVDALPRSLAKRLFPVGIFILYDKE